MTSVLLHEREQKWNSIFELNVSKVIDREMLVTLDDILRAIVIQIIVQFMSAASGFMFSPALFAQTVLYTILGIGVYWLVVRKVVAFK
jgi:hypothetical protein